MTVKKPSLTEYIPNEYGRTWVTSQHVARRGTYVPKAYVDICGGHESDAKVFAQLMFWHQPNDDDEGRLTLFREDFYWVAKGHNDWFSETRTKRVTVRKCLDRLRDHCHLIYVLLGGFKGNPTPYIRINWDEFERRMKRWVELEGEVITEAGYKAFLKKLATPKPLAERYQQQQAAYKKLSDEMFTSDKKEQTSAKKYQTFDLLDQTPLILCSKPLIFRITSNTEKKIQNLLRSSSKKVEEGAARPTTTADPFHPIHRRFVGKGKKPFIIERSAANAEAPPSPPVPQPPAPPVEAGGRAGEGGPERTPHPPHIINFERQLRKGAGDAITPVLEINIHTHPLWQAFRERWKERTNGVELPVPVRSVNAYASAAARLDEMGVTTEQIAQLADLWIDEGRFTFPFSWAPDRITGILSADGARKGKRRTPAASPVALSILTLERELADPNLPAFRAGVAFMELTSLLRDQQPDAGPPAGYWPARDRNESVDDYLRRRQQVWQDMRATGSTYYSRERAEWAEPEYRATDRIHLPIKSGKGETAADVWQSAIEQIAVQLDAQTYTSSLRDAVLVDFDPTDDAFVILVSSVPARDLCQQRLSRTVSRILRGASGLQSVELCFMVEEEWIEAQGAFA